MDAPQSAGIELRFSSEISRTKERADFCSPTENHQKSINPPKPKLTEAPNTTILIAPPNKPRRLAERLGGHSTKNPSPLPGLRYRSTFVSRKLPSHVFASHHLRLAFAPLRACSALPCSCLEPSALGVRPALFSSRLQKPTSQVAHASPELRHRLFVGFGRVSPPFHSGETLPRQVLSLHKFHIYRHIHFW